MSNHYQFTNAEMPAYKFPHLIYRKGKNSKYMGYTLFIPESYQGTLSIPDIGLFPIPSHHALDVDEEDNFLFHQSEILMNCRSVSLPNQRVQSNKIRYQFQNVSPFVWEVRFASKKQKLFLNLTDAMDCFFDHPDAEYMNKFSIRYAGWGFTKGYVLKRKHNQYSYLPPLLPEEKERITIRAEKENMKQEMFFSTEHSHMVSGEDVAPSTIERIQLCIEDIDLHFQQVCKNFKHMFSSHSPQENRVYGVSILPDPFEMKNVVPYHWFHLACLPQVPDFYKKRIQPDGSLVLKFPDFCNTWTKEEREFVVNVLFYDYTNFNQSWNGNSWYYLGMMEQTSNGWQKTVN